MPRRRRCADGADHAAPLDSRLPVEEVAEPDGKPLKVRLLGEDLVVFRDSDGRLGIIDEYCPHRRVSLAYGRNEECGLRCLYHGWKMDVRWQRGRDGVGAAGKRLRRKGEDKSLSGTRMGRLRLDLYGTGGNDSRNSSRRLSRQPKMPRSRSSRSTSAAIGRKSWKARSIRRIPRACIPPT